MHGNPHVPAKKQNNLQTVAFRIVCPSVHHLFLAALYGFPALQVASLYMGSTCQENPGFDCLVHIGLLERHGVWHSALLRPQSVLGAVSKYLSCIHGEESATLSPYFPALHALLPKQLGDLRASLYSQKNATPSLCRLLGTLKRAGLKPASRSHLLSVEVPMILGGGNKWLINQEASESQ